MSKQSTQSGIPDELSSFITSSKELGELKLISDKGASAWVYSASWKGELVAVKKFGASAGKEDAKEIVREAKIMLKAGSKSSHLMPLKGICIEPKSEYYAIVMELMHKGSLHDVLQADQKLPWTIRYQIACDVSYGLRDLHGQDFIHRDLKSFNILLDGSLRAKLTDFGIARPIGPDFAQTILKTGETHNGSLPWMAPELFEKGSSWTKEADIYSLGMVLLELVTGKIPARKPTLSEEFTVISIDDAKIPETICPPELKQLIQSCQKTAARRPTAIKVIQKLEPLLTTAQLEAKVQSLEKEKRQQAEQHQREMQQLKKATKEMEEKMAQIQLAAKKRLKFAQRKIKQLKQKNQALEQQQEGSKQNPLQTTGMTSSSGSPLLSVTTSQNLPIFPSDPKSTGATPREEQLKLQKALILACEDGDEKEVKNCLIQGAKPDVTNAAGRHPVGAAVWGMNPEVVTTLLKQLDGVSPMTWSECEAHNKHHYNKIFKVDEQSLDYYSSISETIKTSVCVLRDAARNPDMLVKYYHYGLFSSAQTKDPYASYRSQIKQAIERALRPELGKSF